MIGHTQCFTVSQGTWKRAAPSLIGQLSRIVSSKTQTHERGLLRRRGRRSK